MQQNPSPAESDQWEEGDFDPPEIYDDKGPFDRFAEAFSSPSEAFEGLGESPRKTSIIVWGFVLGAIVTILATVLLTANPKLSDAVLQQQLDAIEKQYESGDLSEEQRDAAVKAMEQTMKGEGMMKYLTLGAAPVVSVIGWTLAGLVVLGIASALKKNQESILFSTALSTYLIALMIPLLEKLVLSLGMYFTSDMNFALDPNYFLGSDSSLVKFIVGLAGPFTLWWFFVLGTGISKISGGSRAAAIGIWALTYIVINGIFVGIGMLTGRA